MNPVHEIHCETCGRPIAAEASDTRYCLECGLYVCVGCWDQTRDLCLNCATRPRRGIRLRTARRADRRLREVVREAHLLTVKGPESERDAWIEHASLVVKSEAASRLGLRAWQRLGGDRARRTRSLGDRIERHSHQADDAVERARRTLLRRGIERDQTLREETAPHVMDRVALRASFGRYPAAATAVLVAAVVAVIVLPLWSSAPDDATASRQGTLAETMARPTSPVASMEPGVAAATSGPTLADAIETLDFDRERMGQGLGSGWVQTGGATDAVALVPLPNAVNRSARLESQGRTGAEACRPIGDAQARISSLAADVLLLDPNTEAMIIGRTRSGSPAFQVRLGSGGITLTGGGGDPLARADGPPVGEWIRTEIKALGEGTGWHVVGQSSGEGRALTVAASLLRDATHLCLAVTTNSIGAAHFDNLSIVTVEEG